jgi:hypothetical protein
MNRDVAGPVIIINLGKQYPDERYLKALVQTCDATTWELFNASQVQGAQVAKLSAVISDTIAAFIADQEDPDGQEKLD